MKRHVCILLACLCLTACHKATTTDNTPGTGSAIVSDSAIVKCIADYWRQRYNTDEWYEEGICPAQQPDTSGRLYEAWYDVTGYLVLVNLQDTTVADFLEQHPIITLPEYLDLMDSTQMIYEYDSKYLTRGDTIVIQEYNNYVLHKYDSYSKEHNSSYDTLLIELSETRYLMADTFVPLSHTDTTLRHFDHVAKSYFNERDYNEKLYWLHKQIMAGDSIPDEQLLDAMPKNKDQYLVYYHDYYYPDIERSLVIDSIAISRAKENPLFRDAYITMYGWADGWPAETISEVYCPMFFYYDSVYFRDAIRRILPEYVDMFEADYVDAAINDIGWLRWVREHKEEILGSQP